MEQMRFKISSALKDLIGKDLITNDNVAIFELVKNSYDAYATKVEITFEEDKIIIADNGKGMTFNDVRDKWLFLGFSAKRMVVRIVILKMFHIEIILRDIMLALKVLVAFHAIG